jgi:hypothetical protein
VLTRMQSTPSFGLRSDAAPSSSAVLALLADHLDAVLRHGETLRDIERPSTTSAFSGQRTGAMLRRNKDEAAVARDAHALELAIVLRLRQARAVLDQVGKSSPSRAALFRLIAVATDPLAGLELHLPTGAAGAFFVSRGLPVGIEAPAPMGEHYLIGASIPLGAVMDTVAAALDLIDTLAALPPARV